MKQFHFFFYRCRCRLHTSVFSFSFKNFQFYMLFFFFCFTVCQQYVPYIIDFHFRSFNCRQSDQKIRYDKRNCKKSQYSVTFGEWYKILCITLIYTRIRRFQSLTIYRLSRLYKETFLVYGFVEEEEEEKFRITLCSF